MRLCAKLRNNLPSCRADRLAEHAIDLGCALGGGEYRQRFVAAAARFIVGGERGGERGSMMVGGGDGGRQLGHAGGVQLDLGEPTGIGGWGRTVA